MGGARNAVPGGSRKGGLWAPLSNPPGERPGTGVPGAGCCQGDDGRFVPPDPPHSVLALLSEDMGECVWR